MRSRAQGSRLKPAADGSSGKVGHEKKRTAVHFEVPMDVQNISPFPSNNSFYFNHDC
ncbi:hypothetical protein CGCSCA1_v012584 [Colletotrichum siamense]|nr:hypothetical protein CGCSCA1_v012584 [Colletotrichum siamense]